VATVAIYGLTAVPVGRRLGVTRPARTRPLLIGGDPWIIDLARALRTAGLDVLMWAPSDGQRTQIKQAGLELAPGGQLASAVAQGADIEGVTAVLLLTGEDDYNVLAATTLAGNSDTPVYRLPPSESGVVASYTPGEALFTPTLTHPALRAEAHYWLGKGIVYNMNGSHRDPQGRMYRTDCSGYVSMALHLSSSLSTVTLPGVGHKISKKSLAAGDYIGHGHKMAVHRAGLV
jgi:hypothetical protein